jgi:hypothetical protein
MATVTCTRHKQNFDATQHQGCPLCEYEGVVSISVAKTIREIKRIPPPEYITFDIFDFSRWWTP